MEKQISGCPADKAGQPAGEAEARRMVREAADAVS